MKRNNKKGFTIVELVIVIAVIAILSAVLIPTFGGVTGKAQEAARDQEAKNIYTTYIAEHDYVNNGTPVEDCYVVVDGYYYEVADGNFVDIDESQTTISPVASGMCSHNVLDNGSIITVGTHAVVDGECAHCGAAL